MINTINSAIRTLMCLCSLLALSEQAFAQGNRQPNIILIMADDLGYGDLGVYGQKRIQSPHLDALAEQGMRFTNYYSGSTVCAPSREALLTGKHTGHTYIRGNFLTDEKEDPAMPFEKETIAEFLKMQGYRTGLIGKWGLGGEGKGPEKQGFDASYGYLDQIQAHNYYPPFLYENGNKLLIPENQNEEQGVYSHDLFLAKTVDFLQTKSDQPFFLYLPYTIPHGKHVIPNQGAYAGENWTKQQKNYAAMISRLDADIGMLIELLETQGLRENTVILFMSDNGANPGFAQFFASNGEFRGHKTTLYEGGIRVPLIVNWPGKIQAGKVSDHVTASWDIFATLAQVAGAKPPKGTDGISILPTLLGQQKQQEHPYLYWEYYTYNYNWDKPESKEPRNWLAARAVRLGKWKAVSTSFPHNDAYTIELYDLEIDQGEKNDVSAAHPEIIKQVKDIFKRSSTKDAPFFPYKMKMDVNAIHP